MFKTAWLMDFAVGPGAAADRWRSEYASAIRAVPGLTRYVQTDAIGCVDADGNRTGKKLSFEVYESVWWESRENYLAALPTSEWTAVLSLRGELFVNVRGFALRENVRLLAPGHWDGVGESATKAFWGSRFRPDLDPEAARKHWFDVHGGYALKEPRLLSYVQNHAEEALDPTGLPVGADDLVLDGFSEGWFADDKAYREAMVTPEWMAVRNDSPNIWNLTAMFGGYVGVVKDRIPRDV